MKPSPRRIALAKLSRIAARRARLLAELAELAAEEADHYAALVGGDVDLVAGRKARSAAVRALPEPRPEVARAADAAIRANALRRRAAGR